MQSSGEDVFTSIAAAVEEVTIWLTFSAEVAPTTLVSTAQNILKYPSHFHRSQGHWSPAKVYEEWFSELSLDTLDENDHQKL